MNAAPAQPPLMVSKPIGPGRLVLVVGPSGAGKDTVIAGTKAACSSSADIVFPRRVVTRSASVAEDHDTLTDDAFDHAVGNGSFAFWWQAHGLKYAIWRSADDDVRFGRTVVCNVSRGIVPNLRMRYARVDAVLITAPVNVLSARLAGRARETGGTLVKRLERNDTFTEFRADYVIENTSAPEAAVQMLLGVIFSTNEGDTRRW